MTNSLSLIAIAPWISADCTAAYFESARGDANVRAFVLYLIDNGTAIPPLANSAVWSLKDGGRWKSTNKYPVYAIPSLSGQAIMKRLADYSGNVTAVPNGHELANQYPPSDYIRLAAEIDIGELMFLTLIDGFTTDS